LWPVTVQGRDRLRIGAILVSAGLLGYLLTCVAYPAPLIPRDQAVARVLGLPLEQAQKELVAQGFKVKLEEEQADPVIPARHILWQDPAPETGLPPGAVVRLTVSSGPGTIYVPDVVSFEVEQGRQILETAGLRVTGIDTVSNSAEPGLILATRPGSGASRPPGGTVELVVSRGPADIRIPEVTGLKQEEAREKLEAAGLKVGTVTNRAARRNPVGVVLDQRPAAGVLAPQGARVSLVISN
jgi:serine/threonine-protein kinase